MIEGWKNVELEDVCTIKGGKRLPKDHHLQEEITDHPYIRARDIRNGKINFDQPSYISNQTFEKISRYIVNLNDVVITIVGANIGDTAFITKEFDGANLTENAVKLVSHKNKIDPLFLKYALVPDYMKYYFQTVASGAAQDKLGIYKIKKIKLSIPPLHAQRKIASILSAYDDLIENNLKRIKLLEEKAQLTYEEWFVRMKFPGHETTAINKEAGLPEGWKKGKLSELIGYQSGFAYKSARFTDEGYPVIKIKNIDNNTIDTSNTNFIDKEYAEQTEKFKLKSGDLLIAMTGATVGKVGIVPVTNKPCYLNQRVGRFLIKGNIDNRVFANCFFTIGGGINHILNIAGGAAQPNISATQILSIDSIVPPNNILKKFSELVVAGANTILNFQNQNQLLKEARDILLPRLMTGMIDVEKLNEIEVAIK